MKKPIREIIVLVTGLLCAVRGLAATDAGDSVTTPESAGIVEFTADERAWIAAHPVIRVGHDPSYAPYAIREKSGQIVGIDPDYLELVARRTGLKFQNEVRLDWPTVLTDFKARQLDLLPSVSRTAEREEYMIFTEPYVSAPNVIITRSDSPYLFSLRELKGRTISVPRGYSLLRNDLERNAPGNVIVEYGTTADCYEAVARGAVFASIGDLANASYVIRQQQLTNLRLGGVISSTPEIYFAVRKDWPMLAQIINKALAGIPTEDRQRINNRWITVDYAASHWWLAAFKVAAAIAAVAVVVFVLVFLHNRRLARELAERRRIQAELEQAHRCLARINEEKSELLRMVTHDLRNPLAGLTLGLELLHLSEPGGETTRQTLKQMSAAAQQMTRLTNDLMDANVLETGRRNFTWAAVDAAALFRETVEGLVDQAGRKAIHLSLVTAEPVMPIKSDLTALRQVADNLISNAVKYSPRDSAVDVDLRWSGTGLRVQVRDHGPGISPGQREKIFTQFGQGEAKPTGGEKSTGLGLWIVQRVVTGLHGRVWCESAPEQGTVFIVELPRTPPVLAA